MATVMKHQDMSPPGLSLDGNNTLGKYCVLLKGPIILSYFFLIHSKAETPDQNKHLHILGTSTNAAKILVLEQY